MAEQDRTKPRRRPRWALLLGFGVAPLLLVLPPVVLAVRMARTAAGYSNVTLGMSQTQVIEMVGRPGGTSTGDNIPDDWRAEIRIVDPESFAADGTVLAEGIAEVWHWSPSWSFVDYWVAFGPGETVIYKWYWGGV